jgi:hypothetical protein
MAVLRFFAGPVVHKLSPTGILVSSAILAGVGLYWFSFAETTAMAFASATVFAVGVCYFWPTMLGVTSERVPRSGALGLALMGGTGMLVVGLVTAPQMGRVADRFLHEQLESRELAVAGVLGEIVSVYPADAEQAREPFKSEILAASNLAKSVADATLSTGVLPKGRTAAALRTAIKNAPRTQEGERIVEDAQALLNPADNYGGRVSFRYVAPFSLLIIVVFGILYLRDRAAGGYRPEAIHAA